MKLLYAEDERSLSEAVVDILTYHKYIVDAVYDGEDAYAYALSGNYDGVILDVMMPGRDISFDIPVDPTYVLLSLVLLRQARFCVHRTSSDIKRVWKSQGVQTSWQILSVRPGLRSPAV